MSARCLDMHKQLCIAQVGKEQLSATVELVKDDYVVLSLPKHGHALGFAAVNDFNLQNQEGRSPLKQGQVVQARVAALPSPASGVHCLFGPQPPMPPCF